jgi:hypothetical protein
LLLPLVARLLQEGDTADCNACLLPLVLLLAASHGGTPTPLWRLLLRVACTAALPEVLEPGFP